MPKHSTKRESSKPDKPYPGFPLTAHPCGQWCKKIKGKPDYFGIWDDPDAAYQLFEKERHDLYEGRSTSRDAGTATVSDVLNLYLHHQKLKVAAGDLAAVTWDDYVDNCRIIKAAFGGNTDASSLKPADFARLRVTAGGKYSPARTSKLVTVTRQIFKWAFEAEVLDQMPRFGPDFKTVSKQKHRLHKADGQKKLLTRDELLAMLKVADVKWKAILLLCINGGLGNTDISALETAHLDLESRWLEYARRKTGIERRIPLWEETIDALRAAIRDRPAPHAGCDSLVFLTKAGTAMVRVRDNGKRTDLTTEGFRRLAEKAGVHRKGMGLYWIRDTFQTVGDGAKDPVATSAIMGHADDSMAANYREQIDNQRLTDVVDYVRRWLFGSAN